VKETRRSREQREADEGCSTGSIAAAAMHDISDEVLIERITGRDQDAFETLYCRYYDRLFRFIIRVTGRLGMIEETINDTMYVVWQKAATFNGCSRPSTWIFAIAYKKALKSLSRRKYTPHPDLECSLDETQPCHKTLHSEQLETENWLAAAFDRIPPEQRATVELTYYFGMSYREIADVMDCSENTVKTRMFHARRKLKSILPQLADPSARSAHPGE